MIAAGLLLNHLTGSLLPAIIAGTISVILAWWTQWKSISHFKPAGGYANWVTTIRFFIVLIIVYFSPGLDNLELAMLFTIPVLLDGADGFLARKMRQKSDFGAHLDMETDSLFVALTSLILYYRDIAGAWILIAGYMRYGYIILLLLTGQINISEKRTRFGPAVAVFMFISLLAAFILPLTFARLLLALASLVVCVSFGYSFVSLFINSKHISS